MGVTDPSLLAASFQYVDSIIPGGKPAGTLLLKPNPHRVAFFVSASSGNLSIRPGSLDPVNPGIFMGGTSGFGQLFKFADIGGVVTMGWVITTATTGQINVAEFIYYPLE